MTVVPPWRPLKYIVEPEEELSGSSILQTGGGVASGSADRGGDAFHRPCLSTPKERGKPRCAQTPRVYTTVPKKQTMRPPSDSMLSSLVGSCCLLLALVDRSTAFLASGAGAGAGRAAGPAVSSARRGTAVSFLGGKAMPVAAAALVPVVGAAGERQRRRGRTQQLGMMAIDTTNNPITSKVYGRADAKGGSKTPDMNEEIAASGVG